MALGWQDLVALGIVSLAVLYLARLALGALTRKQANGCGAGCGKCSSRSGADDLVPEQVVAIGIVTGSVRK